MDGNGEPGENNTDKTLPMANNVQQEDGNGKNQ